MLETVNKKIMKHVPVNTYRIDTIELCTDRCKSHQDTDYSFYLNEMMRVARQEVSPGERYVFVMVRGIETAMVWRKSMNSKLLQHLSLTNDDRVALIDFWKMRVYNYMRSHVLRLDESG